VKAFGVNRVLPAVEGRVARALADARALAEAGAADFV
jgi:hypothetical protein